jgi:hypothetical protein
MYVEKEKRMRISEFFKTFYGLFLFTVKSLWVLLKTDMDKNVQTYKEEREKQKRIKNNGK